MSSSDDSTPSSPQAEKPAAKPEARVEEKKVEEKKAEEKKAEPERPPQQSAVGRFIQTYHTFLSTFVIGAAGLIATSIWQYKQSDIARRQSESAETLARTHAENEWRIERAEILSKNLQVLASRGGGTADQRYGVLLSLTRGAILDPELAVSYALELGRDNPEYMKSVLSSTLDKDYAQLAHSFVLTCEQRFGIARQTELCKHDELGPRSDAIAHLISDDTETYLIGGAAATGRPDAGPAASLNGAVTNPIAILRDERSVQKEPARIAWLYTPVVQDLYQRKQWGELRKLEASAIGAHIVTALVLSTVRTDELRNSSERDEIEKLHAAERKFLGDYVLAPSCDDDCRGRFVDYFLTGFSEAEGDFDDMTKRILLRPTAESGTAVGRLHARLARCQFDPADASAFRDRALVPALGDALSDKTKPDAGVIENLADLMALVAEPTDPAALAAWQAVLGRLQKVHPDKFRKNYGERRASAEAEKRNPPAAVKKVDFCKAGAVEELLPSLE